MAELRSDPLARPFLEMTSGPGAGELPGRPAPPRLRAESSEMGDELLPSPQAVSLQEARRDRLDLGSVRVLTQVEPEGGPELDDLAGSVCALGNVAGAWTMNPHRARAHRIVDRDQILRHSCGRVMIRRRGDSLRSTRWWQATFHSVVYLSTWKVFLISSVIVFFSWVVFAIMFRVVSHNCGLQANTFLRAFYLAIETVETIGYGVPDPYFHDCKSGVVVLTGAALWESLLNAVVIALIYTRLSRPQGRARSICFSDKAIIAEMDGHIYFMVQVVDVRKHQLIEAHVRLYCIQHSEAERGVMFQTRAMRLQHPDDELGGMMLLALPQLIVHRVDPWSPLWPGPPRARGSSPATGFRFPDVLQRQADVENGNRDGRPLASLSAAAEAAEAPTPMPTLAEVADRFQKGQLEVLCVVEGIEPTTSGTMQARQSYTCDDVVFNAAFQRCVRRAEDGMCEFNFDAFHELVELNGDGNVVVQGMA
mmetsp:Transcript_80840/g.210610  ORF Transcript_80840/g.210610 Transcript_80840/m.210610 type:complete len:479 (-) Transcript_80840:90-1526(-)